MKGLDKSLNGNPQVGNDIYTGDPALEFIKHVCAVMALDQNVQHDILVIPFFFVGHDSFWTDLIKF